MKTKDLIEIFKIPLFNKFFDTFRTVFLFIFLLNFDSFHLNKNLSRTIPLFQPEFC